MDVELSDMLIDVVDVELSDTSMDVELSDLLLCWVSKIDWA